MELTLYQVDAFTSEPFGGNPAAVVPLERAWPEDGLLQRIAAENNLSETAFFVPGAEGGGIPLRWFTPVAEVELCGHATLAAAWVFLHRIRPDRERVRFRTRGGALSVERGEGDVLVMDFPSTPPVSTEAPRALVEGLGAAPAEVMAATRRDYLVAYDDEETVRKLKPDFHRLRAVDRPGVIVTAPGETCDFVSRFFAPSLGIPEDPVTGSAHCALTPYWAARLGRDRLRARQISARGGEILCELAGDDRVLLSGRGWGGSLKRGRPGLVDPCRWSPAPGHRPPRPSRFLDGPP